MFFTGPRKVKFPACSWPSSDAFCTMSLCSNCAFLQTGFWFLARGGAERDAYRKKKSSFLVICIWQNSKHSYMSCSEVLTVQNLTKLYSQTHWFVWLTKVILYPNNVKRSTQRRHRHVLVSFLLNFCHFLVLFKDIPYLIVHHFDFIFSVTFSLESSQSPIFFVGSSGSSTYPYGRPSWL